MGAPVLEHLTKNVPEGFVDAHMMVEHPHKYVDDFAKAGAKSFTFHVEAAGRTFHGFVVSPFLSFMLRCCT